MVNVIYSIIGIMYWRPLCSTSPKLVHVIFQHIFCIRDHGLANLWHTDCPRAPWARARCEDLRCEDPTATWKSDSYGRSTSSFIAPPPPTHLRHLLRRFRYVLFYFSGPYGPIRAHMGPYGPVWARPGPLKSRKSSGKTHLSFQHIFIENRCFWYTYVVFLLF